VRRLTAGTSRRRETELSVRVGSVELANPVMTASGTSGHGAELAPYMDLSSLGAVVVKSLSSRRYPGNPPPRLHETPSGMLNSVGLQGPGVAGWLEEHLPLLVGTGAKVVASIWGERPEDYAEAARLLSDAPPEVVAVEVNVSCPNLEDREKLFAHSPAATAEAVDAAGAAGRPLWAKLSPNVADLCEVAASAIDAGAEALTLVNTLLGLSVDVERRRPLLGGVVGGLSGPAVRPVAVRAVYDCRQAFPDVAIVGVGGVARGTDAVELLLAGADAIQVGTASFAEPAAAVRVLRELHEWCDAHGVERVIELRGGAHGQG
jgi:dihydroorotate dehydrogenase (NAD+) catalytic subunit